MPNFWQPDTCRNGQCIVEIGAAFSFLQVLQKCQHHADRQAAAGVTDEQGFNILRNRNRDKNYSVAEVVAWIEANRPELVYSWAVDDQDRIIITIPGLTNPQRSNIQTRVDTRVGAGKVIIQ